MHLGRSDSLGPGAWKLLEKQVWGLELLLVLVELQDPGMSGRGRGLGVRSQGSSQTPEQRWQLGSGSMGEGICPWQGCPRGHHPRKQSWGPPSRNVKNSP